MLYLVVINSDQSIDMLRATPFEFFLIVQNVWEMHLLWGGIYNITLFSANACELKIGILELGLILASYYITYF